MSVSKVSHPHITHTTHPRTSHAPPPPPTHSILVCEDGRVKISDFGVSRSIGDRSTKMSFVGTVAWMAPEVIRHEACSEKVDVWAYGVLLWEMLTQEMPYKVMLSV